MLLSLGVTSMITLCMAFREAETSSRRKTQGKFIGNVNRSYRSWTRRICTIFYDGEHVAHLNEALAFRVEHWPHSIPWPLATWNSSWNSPRPGGSCNKPNSTYLRGILYLELAHDAVGVLNLRVISTYVGHLLFFNRTDNNSIIYQESINGH